MFPYYCRFVPKERRIRAFEALKKMKGYSNHIMQQKQREGVALYLRYCPKCVKQDREYYGEAYFHRIHQMKEIPICPVHGCYLENSSIPKKSSSVTMLKTLEEEEVSTNIVICEDEKMRELAIYVKEVFGAKMDFDSDILVRKFMHFKLKDTPYLSKRGAQRNMEALCSDLDKNYETLTTGEVLERWKVERVFIDDNLRTYDVCQVAMFLGIPIEELVHMECPEKPLEQSFDEKILELRERGLSYPEIAKRMDSSINTVKPIGEGIRGKYCRSRAKNIVPVRSFDWEKIDEEMLPKVVAACKEIYGVGTNRPHMVNRCSVSKRIGYKDKSMAQLKRCREEIEKYKETWEEYGAREIAWAIDEIDRTNTRMNIGNVMRLTNMSKANIIRCIPYMKNESREIAEAIL